MSTNKTKKRKTLLASLLIVNAFLLPNTICLADTNLVAMAASPSPQLLAQQPGTDEPPLKASIQNVDPNSAMYQIDDLTRQIMLKIIQIEKFNLHYSMEVAKQGRWKGWRYGGFQEVNGGMGLAGAIIGTANRGYHLSSPTHVWTQLQESACYVPMIGAIIGASAAALEFDINAYHDWQANRKGFSRIKARNHVMAINKEIGDLMEKRDALLRVEASAPYLAPHTAIDTAEGKILIDLRNQAILEFARFQVNARKLIAFQQSQYFFDLAKYTLNAIGYEFAFLSLHRHHRVWNLRAGVMWDIAGPIYMGAPIVSRLIGKGVGEMNKHFLKPLTKDAEGSTIQTLEADCEVLRNLSANTGAPSLEAALERKDMYLLQDKRFSEEISSGLKSRANAKLSATQNIAAGFFVGSLKLAQGILFTVPGYYTAYNTKTVRAAYTTNTDLFAGSVTQIPANAVAMLDTLRINIKGEINRRKLIKAGRHPSQIVAARLKELDEIEAKLIAAGKNSSR